MIMMVKETFKCPQCGAKKSSLRAMRAHLGSGTMGEKNEQGYRTWECPPWPKHQIDYYEEKGLFNHE